MIGQKLWNEVGAEAHVNTLFGVITLGQSNKGVACQPENSRVVRREQVTYIELCGRGRNNDEFSAQGVLFEGRLDSANGTALSRAVALNISLQLLLSYGSAPRVKRRSTCTSSAPPSGASWISSRAETWRRRVCRNADRVALDDHLRISVCPERPVRSLDRVRLALANHTPGGR